ncbi:hypothetical protein D0863_05624 [Hortaea werneckii]|uniref:Steroid 5-alpha reductase C-terminal domain-containing protein n=1 Tax=Hortaea werneckii TaxID=91943 RepID=A0A3M7E285_HORWE|nr:hypothetical protein D0863_05624 [Hortaea werneckii]
MSDQPKRPEEIQAGPSSSGYDPGQWYWESRKKRSNPMGTAVFNILRLADLPLQYYLLRYSSFLPDLIRKIGGTAIPLSSPLSATGIAGLSPYQTLILGLAAGSSAKQVYWKLMINDTNMPSGFSTAICAYNTLLNTLNTGLAYWALTSQVPADQGSFLSSLTTAPAAVPVGLGFYTVGIFVEWYSEIQRKRFKSHPENKDKPYSDGLFGLARSINYGGYTLWRVGYSLICGGWTWGALVAVWLAGDFCARAIPSMDAYCEKRDLQYGSQWAEVKKKVPYGLLPWIY